MPSHSVPLAGPASSPGVLTPTNIPAPTGRNITAQCKAPRAAALGYAPPYPVTPKEVEPFAGQNEIVAELERRLSVVEALEAVVTANRQRATRLRQSILQKAFTGQLT